MLRDETGQTESELVLLKLLLDLDGLVVGLGQLLAGLDEARLHRHVVLRDALVARQLGLLLLLLGLYLRGRGAD